MVTVGIISDVILLGIDSRSVDVILNKFFQYKGKSFYSLYNIKEK